jgi:hypothetical protein
MPNILTEQLPSAVEIDGQEYPIESDFRACLRVILAFEDPELTAFEKQAVLLENLYTERPSNLARAFELGIRFLNGGTDTNNDDAAEPTLRLFSFSQDANFIFAAFRQTHGIDLETAQLHWWKFLALFMDLGSETTFCNLVSLRKRIKTGRASKEELRAYREMQEVIDLPEPDTRTMEEREQEETFMRLVREAEKVRGQKVES